MHRDPEKLRDRAAQPALQRIRGDSHRVSKELKPLLVLIESRLFDPKLDVNTLWRVSGLNKGRATSRFGEELGVTPWVYITDRRLEVAADLLTSTDLKIYQIGQAVGYDACHDTFSKAFSRGNGLTPSAYRQSRGARNGKPPGYENTAKAANLIDDPIIPAAAYGDPGTSRRGASRADEAAGRDRELQELAARLGLASHERAVERTRDGDVDRAWDDLALARHCYAAAGRLPPAVKRRRRLMPVSHSTDAALSSALCPECRARLAGDEGRTVRRHLCRSLLLVPRDLAWFDASCDECYRVVWQAISRARHGLMEDAWKAWWLSVNVDLDDHAAPPSRGRIIAALDEVEKRVLADQLERKVFCDLAVEDAVAIGDPMLEAGARIWLGGVLRALSEFTEARAELAKTAEASRETPWLAALKERMAGILENDLNNSREALDLLRSAATRYESLDPHVCGLLLMQQASVYFFQSDFEETIALAREALHWLDCRRDPLPANAAVPIHLASSYALLGKWAKAESALEQCRLAEDAGGSIAAAKTFTHACLELLRGRAQVSLRLFAEAKECFEKLNRPLDYALAASYSVEAHARLGDWAGAVENASAALGFFQTAGCSQDAIDALRKLQYLMRAKVIDVTSVTANVRCVTRRLGGWLPEPEQA